METQDSPSTMNLSTSIFLSLLSYFDVVLGKRKTYGSGREINIDNQDDGGKFLLTLLSVQWMGDVI